MYNKSVSRRHFFNPSFLLMHAVGLGPTTPKEPQILVSVPKKEGTCRREGRKIERTIPRMKPRPMYWQAGRSINFSDLSSLCCTLWDWIPTTPKRSHRLSLVLKLGDMQKGRNWADHSSAKLSNAIWGLFHSCVEIRCDWCSIFHILISDASLVQLLENPWQVSWIGVSMKASFRHSFVVNTSPGDTVAQT